MRKILLGLAATAAIVAPIAMATSADAAGTPRCQTDYVTSSTTTATFNAIEPAGAYDQWDNVWTHDYTVTVNTDGTFTGTGVVNGDDGTNKLVNEPETVFGQFTDSEDDADDVSDHVTFTGTRNSVSYTLTNSLGTGQIETAKMSIETPEPIKFKVSMPEFTAVTTDGVTDFANHGEYVAAQGGGKIAAQQCAGMPLVSKQGKA